MADLPEESVYPAGIYQIEVDDPVQGGPGGIVNAAPAQLANRTLYLRDRLNNLPNYGPQLEAAAGIYASLQARLDAIDPAGAITPELDPEMWELHPLTLSANLADWTLWEGTWDSDGATIRQTDAGAGHARLVSKQIINQPGLFAVSADVQLLGTTPLDNVLRAAFIGVAAYTDASLQNAATALMATTTGALAANAVGDTAEATGQVLLPAPTLDTPHRLIAGFLPYGLLAYADQLSLRGRQLPVGGGGGLALALRTRSAAASFGSFRLYRLKPPAL